MSDPSEENDHHYFSQLNRDMDKLESHLRALTLERDGLLAENERLRTALRWYASDDSWRLDSDNQPAYIESSQAANDSGDRARTALGEDGKPDV